MPTGYTAMIEEDGITDARAYIEKCSRAFGIAIHQREDDVDKPLEYPTKNTWDQEALQKAVDELDALKARSAEKIDRLHKNYVLDTQEANQRTQQRHDRQQANYQTVLDKLSHWRPEDEISQNIKKFAIDQINLCYKPYEEAWLSKIEYDAKVWYQSEVERAQKSVEFYTKRVEESDARYLEQIRNIDIVRKEFLKVPR